MAVRATLTGLVVVGTARPTIGGVISFQINLIAHKGDGTGMLRLDCSWGQLELMLVIVSVVVSAPHLHPYVRGREGAGSSTVAHLS